MAQELQAHQPTALTLTSDQQAFTDQQVATLRQIGVEHATQEDLQVFFHQCRRTGLDPFARQIYMIGRRVNARYYDQQSGQWRDNWTVRQTIQTGIDGFRLIARRAADQRGETLSIEDTLWCDPKGGWHEAWIWPDTPPAAAKVTVRVGDGRFSGVAALHEYMQTDRSGNPTGQWRAMPAVMIAKCAEALALRKAFPMDLSGLYTAEEMGQADAREQAALADAGMTTQTVHAPQPETQPQHQPQQQQEAEPQPAPQRQAEPVEAEAEAAQDAEIMAGDDMLTEIRDVMTQLKVRDSQVPIALRAITGVGTISRVEELTADQADKVLRSLYDTAAKRGVA